jgi:hypothetical protein
MLNCFTSIKTEKKEMQQIWLSRKNLKKIQSVLDKFTDVDNFELEYEVSPGIGTTLNMKFTSVVNDIQGVFSIPITGFDDW